MRVLVTGGAGYIGSHMVRKLLEEKHRPVVFDDLSTGHRQFVPPEVPFVKGDLKNIQDIRSAFQQHPVDAVMHFAASALVGESVQNPGKYHENNVVAGQHLLEAMRQAKVKRIIFSSSCAVYGEPKRLPIREEDERRPTNPYGQSKRMFENLLHDQAKVSDFCYVALRYFNAAGAHPGGGIGERHDPEAHLIPNVLKVLTGEKKELEIYGDDYDTPDGTCVRDYVHVEDLASAHLLALKYLTGGAKSDAFNLGSGSGHSVKQIISAVEKVTEKKVKLKFCKRRPGDPAQLVASPDKAKKTLGWKPQHDLESMIRTAWEWEKRREEDSNLRTLAG